MRFGVKPLDDPLAELMKLRQMGTMEQYQESFDSLLNRVDLPTPHAISCLLSGLNEKIQTAFWMFEPDTLYDAYCLAKLQEGTLAFIVRKAKPILDQSSSSLRENEQNMGAAALLRLGTLPHTGLG